MGDRAVPADARRQPDRARSIHALTDLKWTGDRCQPDGLGEPPGSAIAARFRPCPRMGGVSRPPQQTNSLRRAIQPRRRTGAAEYKLARARDWRDAFGGGALVGREGAA